MTIGKVIQFRRGRRVIHEKHFLIEINGISSREESEKFVGEKVIWKSPAGKEIIGKVSGAHGNRGLVRAIFEKGLPGQAITTSVTISAGEIKNDNKQNKSKAKRESEIK